MKENKLAILIPTIVGRELYLERVLDILKKQTKTWEVLEKWIIGTDFGWILIESDNKELTIGAKRNKLTMWALALGATHRAFIDDDDTVSYDYIELNMPGVLGDYDCNSLVGIYTVNGVKDPKKHVFIHSLKYDHAWEDATFYYRPPNHLNVIKLQLIKDFKFNDSNFGEDMANAMDIHNAKVLKTEYSIDKPFYNYLFRTKHNGI